MKFRLTPPGWSWRTLGGNTARVALRLPRSPGTLPGLWRVSRTDCLPTCAVLHVAVMVGRCQFLRLLDRNTCWRCWRTVPLLCSPALQHSRLQKCGSSIGSVCCRYSSVIECPIRFTGTNHVSSTRCQPSACQDLLPQLSHVVIIVLVIACPSSARTTCQRHAALGSAPFCCRLARQAQTTAQRLRRLGRQ